MISNLQISPLQRIHRVSSPPIFLHEESHLKSIVRDADLKSLRCTSRINCAAARIIRDRSSSVLGRIALSGSRLHLKLHLIHHCAAENGCERRVRSISAVSNAHEARLWSKASRVEQDPASPKKSFDIGVKVRWIEAVCIFPHESSWDSQ